MPELPASRPVGNLSVRNPCNNPPGIPTLAEQAPGRAEQLHLPERSRAIPLLYGTQPVLRSIRSSVTGRPLSGRIGLDRRYNRHNRSFAQIENSRILLNARFAGSSDSAGCNNFE